MVRRAVVGIFSLVMGLWLFKAPAYLAGLEGPAWMRAVLLLLGLALSSCAITERA